MQADTPVRELKNVGPKTEAVLNGMGIQTVSDLMLTFPRTYERFEEPITIAAARYRDRASIYGVIESVPVTRHVKKLEITETSIRDEAGGRIRVTWFHMPFLSKTLKPGASYVFRGPLSGYGPMRRMTQPKLYKKEGYRALQRSLHPIYSLPKGLSEKLFAGMLSDAIERNAFPPETLTEALRKDYGLISLREALIGIHFPESEETFLTARKRLVFEEFYRFLFNVRELKETVRTKANPFRITEKKEVDALIEALPFELTSAQQKVLREIRENLAGPSVMNRLIQGDVGSGKTILCFLAMYETALNGYESILMAPTEVLAKQHYENFLKLNETYGLGLRIRLLTGNMTAAEKKEVYREIATHATDLIVGTHAVIQKKPVYEDLALVITDEQHRFGVRQRELLKEKGRDPHMIVLSATPIPRTLAMILYGDMDISVIDELPKNRLPIKTAVVDIEYRPKAYRFLARQIQEGRQAYVICPLIEESEGSDGENVNSYVEKLKTALPPGIVIKGLHGRMKSEEKEAIMEEFGANEIQVLVSTTVIEVGIDVANATVMMVENAERFGLAQLHQLRGRVGRGKDQSYCILVDTTCSDESRKRLGILGASTDGFHIASEDLKLRGPGDFFGVEQSGDISFRLADIYKDSAILKLASDAVEQTKPGTGKASVPVL